MHRAWEAPLWAGLHGAISPGDIKLEVGVTFSKHFGGQPFQGEITEVIEPEEDDAADAV